MFSKVLSKPRDWAMGVSDLRFCSSQSQWHQLTLRDLGFDAIPSRGVPAYASASFRRYQVILPADIGTWVWTTCPRLLLDSAATGGSNSRQLSPQFDAFGLPPSHRVQTFNKLHERHITRTHRRVWALVSAEPCEVRRCILSLLPRLAPAIKRHHTIPSHSARYKLINVSNLLLPLPQPTPCPQRPL